MLTKLSLNTRLDRSSRDVIELNVCSNSEVPYVRYLIGRIVKTYDYINRVVLNASAIGLRGYVDNTLPSPCYAITMILRVRRNFFEITTFPNSGIRA